VDVMLAFGIKAEDFVIRLSNRQIWTQYLTEKAVPEEHATTFLSIIDKIERAKPEDTAEKLSKIGLSLEDVRAFMAAADENHPIFATLRADLEARGLWQYVRIDASIVRGLAYYTGTVFEVFDLKHGLRAVAGGGRYDKLCALMSDGSVDMPSAGFAMGDVVLGILLSKTPSAQFGITEYLNSQMGVDAYVVVADEAQRAPALASVQALRAAGVRVDFSMTAQKVGKQFQAAENVKARFALVFGAEYPQVQLKNLVSREQTLVAADALTATVVEALKQPLVGKLIA
jgi:histidyl-tRNA synthetase